MAPNDNCKRIVRYQAGNGTGEQLYQTEDGRWWKVAPWYTADITTMTEFRWLHGDKLCNHK